MSKNTGGPAFPVNTSNTENPGACFADEGMTLRDYFAATAMQGMLAYPGDGQRGSHHNNNTPEGVAAMAYEYSDAMIAEREK